VIVHFKITSRYRSLLLPARGDLEPPLSRSATFSRVWSSKPSADVEVDAIDAAAAQQPLDAGRGT
jgi:hypothetical protein